MRSDSNIFYLPLNPELNTQEKELQLLESIYISEKQISQRDLAAIIGLSLGMTNAIVKRLAHKGLLTIKKVNNRNIMYIVSPKGVEVITKRSYRFFRRTIKNVVYFRHIIEELVKEIKRRNFDGLLIIGVSDLDFIVEHACRRMNIEFVRNEEQFSGQLFYLYSESYIPDEEENRIIADGDVGFLQATLMRIEKNVVQK